MTHSEQVDYLKRQILQRLNEKGDSTFGEMLLVCGYLLRGRRKLRRTDWYLSEAGYIAVRELVLSGRAKLIQGTCRTFLAPSNQPCASSKLLKLAKTH